MSKQTDFDKLGLLGVEIDAVTNAGAIDYICQHAAHGQPACYVVKPYVEFLDRAYHQPELLDLLNGAQLAVPDGVALNWAAAYLYAGKRSAWRFWKTLFQIVLAPNELRWPLPERAAGTNFTWPLLEQAAAQNLGVFLVGKETRGGIELVAEHIKKRIPDIKITGTRTGIDPASKYGSVSNTWLMEATVQVSEAKADLILVGMGFPLQERVCDYLSGHASHGVFIGEGGTFDFESFGGARRKAPVLVQRVGLEWFWRLILEPQRIIRQLAIPRFIYRVWRGR